VLLAAPVGFRGRHGGRSAHVDGGIEEAGPGVPVDAGRARRATGHPALTADIAVNAGWVS